MATEQVGIVIIDDAPRTLDNLKKLLAFEPDIDVIGTAVNAKAGIEQARKLKPDLILMDVNLPDLDGIRATEILSAELPLTPVVIMSVQEDREYLRRAMQAGAREFLVKPFSADELVAAIRRVNQMESLKRGGRRASARPAPAETAGETNPPAAPAPVKAEAQAAPAKTGAAPAKAPARSGGAPEHGRDQAAGQPAVPPSPSAAASAGPPVPAAGRPSAARGAAPAAPAAPPDQPVAALAPPAPPAPPARVEPAPAPAEPAAGEAGASDAVPFQKRRRGNADVVLVFSGKGGVGKSVIAANLAASIARESSEEVALVDLDLQFGDDAVLLGLEPTRTISDIVERYPDVDPPFVTALMLEASPHLRVLPAPTSPELADLVTPEHVRGTLDILRSAFDHVVVDCSTHLGDVTLDALDYADRVVLVTDLGIPAIKETKLSLKLFESLGVARDKIFLVVNRADAGSEITVEQVEANLRFPVSVQVPSRDKVVLNSISRGAPFVTLAPESDISLKIQELAGQMVQLRSPGRSRSGGGKKLRFWQRPA